MEGGARVDLDGAADDDSIFVEVFAHQGPLKGGQIHKVARDALKLITLGRQYPKARLIIALADEDAARFTAGKGWLAEALRAWNIDVVVVDVEDVVRDGLRAAQVRQVMVNPSAAPPSESA